MKKQNRYLTRVAERRPLLLNRTAPNLENYYHQSDILSNSHTLTHLLDLFRLKDFLFSPKRIISSKLQIVLAECIIVYNLLNNAGRRNFTTSLSRSGLEWF